MVSLCLELSVLLALLAVTEGAIVTQTGNITNLVARWKVVGPTPGIKQLRLCVCPWTPQVVCNPKENYTTYTGYQVELWREVAKSVPWLQPEDYFIDCLPYEALVDDLIAPNGTCFAAPTGMDVTMENYKMGIQFSWPTYRSGFKILINRGSMYIGGGAWTVFAAFHWSVWMLLVGTGLLVGILLWFTDQLSAWINKATKQAEKKYMERLMQQQGRTIDDEPSLPGRVLSHGGRYSVQAKANAGTLPIQQPDVEAGTMGQGDTADAVGSQPAWRGNTGSSFVQLPHTDPAAEHAAAMPLKRTRPTATGYEPAGNGFQSNSAADYNGCEPYQERASPPGSNTADQQQQDQSALGDQKRGTGSGVCGAFLIPKGQRRYSVRRLGDSAWGAVGGFVNMAEPPRTRTFPGRLILFFYGLLVVIMIQLYTANTSANLTSQQLKSRITSREDLKEKSVVTWQSYVETLRSYGINAVGLAWETDADEAAMLEYVRNGSAAAMVNDKSFIEHVASTDCSFTALPESFHVWDFSIAYSPRLDKRIVQAIDDAILLAQDQDTLYERLQMAYINIPNSCKDDDSGSQITLRQVAGLWLMLALAVGISYCLLFICYIGRFSRHIRMLAATALPTSGVTLSGDSSGRPRRSTSSLSLSLKPFSWQQRRGVTAKVPRLPQIGERHLPVDGAAAASSTGSEAAGRNKAGGPTAERQGALACSGAAVAVSGAGAAALAASASAAGGGEGGSSSAEGGDGATVRVIGDEEDWQDPYAAGDTSPSD